MTTDDDRYTPPLQDADLSNLITNLNTGERPTSAMTIGDSRFSSVEDLILEMRQNPVPKEKNMVNRLEMFSKVGVVPLAIDSQNDRLLLGINYQDKNGSVRDAAEIGVNLENEVLPYNNYINKRLELVLLDSMQFSRLSKIMRDNASGMTTTSRIQTVNPTTRDLFYEMIKQAIKNRVSDIHIEPLSAKSSRVRFRIDGSLSVANLDLTTDNYKHLVSIIKNDAKLRIDENRRPQDGSITFDEAMIKRYPRLSGYSIRVSTAPISHGEKVALRLLKEQREAYGLESLGYSNDLYLKIKNMAESPNGLVLVTGPTGSGKTTTLYSLLSHLNREDVNIITIEDPIEANLPGINQSVVNRPIGWDFGNMLRTYLRQDPDIILVGEIRDTETAKAAMEAAKTGHIVLSTLHTIDSVSTLLRLYELGVESSDLQSSLNGVVAQRLVRRICPSCRTEYNAAAELNELLNTDTFSTDQTFYRGSGMSESGPCQKCNGIGYYERMVIPEVWVLGDEERNLIGEGCKSIVKYEELAIKKGLKPLTIAGMEAVIAGKTTLDEIIRNVVKSGDLLKRKDQLIEMIKKMR